MVTKERSRKTNNVHEFHEFQNLFFITEQRRPQRKPFTIWTKNSGDIDSSLSQNW